MFLKCIICVGITLIPTVSSALRVLPRTMNNTARSNGMVFQKLLHIDENKNVLAKHIFIEKGIFT